jgi:hypothetical protein
MALPPRIFALAIALLSFSSLASAAITGVSIPVDSSDWGNWSTVDGGVWSVQAPPYPLNTNLGIGHIVGPEATGYGQFSLHDHVYISPNIPDPTRAVVTYTFDASTIVKGVELIQHTNGITQIEGFYGNSPSSLTSLGSVFGPAGDVTGSGSFAEFSSSKFDFGNTTNAGTVFQFVVRKTSLENGWANYNAYPLDVSGNRIAPALAPVPEPDEYLMMLMGAALVGFQVQRKKKLADTQNS